MRFDGKIGIITGGGTGIGEATARGFAAEGGKAVLLGPEQEPLETVAGEIGGVAVVGDAADAGDVGRALAAAKDLAAAWTWSSRARAARASGRCWTSRRRRSRPTCA